MSQGSFIFLALFAAFVVFITSRGELPAYMETLLGKQNPTGNTSASKSSTTSTTSGNIQTASYSGDDVNNLVQTGSNFYNAYNEYSSIGSGLTYSV